MPMSDKPSLAHLRQRLDTLDADWRALLLARTALVAQVAAVKADNHGENPENPAFLPIRPWREAAQLAELCAWQKQQTQMPFVPLSAVLAIWREMIGMSVAQQVADDVAGSGKIGALAIYASPAAQALARAHFGALANYLPFDDSFNNKDDWLTKKHNSIIVVAADEMLALPPADDKAPVELGAFVFARLCHKNGQNAFCYGCVPIAAEAGDSSVTLMHIDMPALIGDGIGADAFNALGHNLYEVAGAFTKASLQERYGEGALWLGCYPRPIDAMILS